MYGRFIKAATSGKIHQVREWIREREYNGACILVATVTNALYGIDIKNVGLIKNGN